MSFSFNADNQKTLDGILARYPNKKAALLPALWLAQKQHGYLPLDAQEEVARVLSLQPGHVAGVVTFYTMFKTEPTGRFHLQACRTLSCALRGSERIISHVKNRLKIDEGQVTKDGKFSLELVECLASCGTAPAMMVNEAYFENLTTDKVDELIERLGRE